jgi:DNA-binding transcriptional regulator YiaG
MFLSAPCPHCGQAMKSINGRWLRDLREGAGLTQREFGKRIGVSSPAISDWERNRRTPPANVVALYRATWREEARRRR